MFKAYVAKIFSIKMIFWFNIRLRLPNFLFFTIGFTHYWALTGPVVGPVQNQDENDDTDYDNLSEDEGAESENSETELDFLGREQMFL